MMVEVDDGSGSGGRSIELNKRVEERENISQAKLVILQA